MRQAIVIGSYRGSPWLKQCVNSIPGQFPTIVVRNGGYECGAISWVFENTRLDRFLFLQDSTMVKDASWIAEHWEQDTSVSLNNEPNVMGSFMGFYRRTILERVTIPDTPDKMSAVLAEMSFCKAYEDAEDEPIKVLWPELNMDIAVTGFRHGRRVAKMENHFFCKWKSTWNGDMIDDTQRRDEAYRKRFP